MQVKQSVNVNALKSFLVATQKVEMLWSILSARALLRWRMQVTTGQEDVRWCGGEEGWVRVEVVGMVVEVGRKTFRYGGSAKTGAFLKADEKRLGVRGTCPYAGGGLLLRALDAAVVGGLFYRLKGTKQENWEDKVQGDCYWVGWDSVAYWTENGDMQEGTPVWEVSAAGSVPILEELALCGVFEESPAVEWLFTESTSGKLTGFCGTETVMEMKLSEVLNREEAASCPDVVLRLSWVLDAQDASVLVTVDGVEHGDVRLSLDEVPEGVTLDLKSWVRALWADCGITVKMIAQLQRAGFEWIPVRGAVRDSPTELGMGYVKHPSHAGPWARFESFDGKCFWEMHLKSACVPELQWGGGSLRWSVVTREENIVGKGVAMGCAMGWDTESWDRFLNAIRREQDREASLCMC